MVRDIAGSLVLQQPADLVQAGSAVLAKTPGSTVPDAANKGEVDAATQKPTAVEKAASGCLPTTWTGNVGDYNLTKRAVACAVDEHV